jgi:hypothetical protein
MPALVVIACDRPESLRRLLRALARSHYPQDRDVPLVIGVDGHRRAAESVAVAQELRWPNGEKRLIVQTEPLGIKEHFFRCGDLVHEHREIVLLEDDLYVSPYFFDFVTLALERYAPDPRIGGLSLYSFGFNECGETPFAAIDDGRDVYFLQSASSWGQVWTRDQWTAFRAWLDRRGPVGTSPLIPHEMSRWPETSWKRLLNVYLAETGKYFVVPRHGLCTNLGEPGVHVSRTITYLSAPLNWGPREWRLSGLQDSRCRYDPFFQLELACLRAWSSVPLPDDLALDLYGQRDLGALTNEWILTGRDWRADAAERSFGIRLFPFEVNLIEGIAGDSYGLVRRGDVLADLRAATSRRMRTFFVPWWQINR